MFLFDEFVSPDIPPCVPTADTPSDMIFPPRNTPGPTSNRPSTSELTSDPPSGSARGPSGGSSIIPWPVIAINIEVVSFLEHCETLSSDDWDFVLCSCVSWLQTVHDALSTDPCDPRVLTQRAVAIYSLSRAVFQLASHVTSSIEKYIDINSMAPPGELNCKYPNNIGPEWKDVFGPAIYGLGVTIFSTIEILNHLVPLIVLQNIAPGNGYQGTVRRLVQLTSYCLLNRIMPLVSGLTSLPGCLATALETSLARCQESEWFRRAEIGPNDDLLVNFDPVQCDLLRGCLLTWSLVVKILENSQNNVEVSSDGILQTQFEQLLNILFRIMTSLSDKKKVSLDYCEDCSSFISSLDPVPLELGQIASRLCLDSLIVMPAVTRKWWNNLDRKSSDYVDKYVMKYLTPALCSRILNTVPEQISGMTVRARPLTREVIAEYSVGDVVTELTIELPLNYPLGAIKVSGDERKVGVDKTQWRKWLLQLTAYLTYQNGSLNKGLGLWKQNADKRFESIDECTICFSILHPSSGQLPRKQCRVCNKHFHPECLYRWFDTNNTSSCPICRNLF